jgi:uridine kinase
MYFVWLHGISWSGKTTLVKKVHEKIPNVLYFSLDSYFFSWETIKRIPNKESLEALDIALFQQDIDAMKQGKWIRRQYDFMRKESVIQDIQHIPLNGIVIIEWIHAFSIEKAIGKYDKKVYIRFPIEEALMRRMSRDFDPQSPDKKIKPLNEYLAYMETYVVPASWDIAKLWENEADIILEKSEDILDHFISSLPHEYVS